MFVLALKNAISLTRSRMNSPQGAKAIFAPFGAMAAPQKPFKIKPEAPVSTENNQVGLSSMARALGARTLGAMGNRMRGALDGVSQKAQSALAVAHEMEDGVDLFN